MDMNTATLPRKGLKTKPYSMDMNKDIATLPKKGLKKYDYNIDMEKKDLKKLTKGQLIKLLLKKEKKPKVVIVDDTKPTRPNRPPPPIPEGVKPYRPTQTVKLRRKQKVVDDTKPVPTPRPPVPTPRNKVNQLVQFFENKPTPPPRTGKWENVKPKPVPRKSVNEDIILPPPKPIPQVEDHIINVPVPKIKELNKALKNSTKSFTVDIVDNKDPLLQLTKTRNVIEQYLNKELGELKGFKYIETLKITFEKQLGNKTTIKTAYFNSMTTTIINKNEINKALQTSRQELMKAIGQWISEGSGWTIQSVDGHYINLTKYKPLKGSSYIELPTELRNSAKGLINLQNKDNECFRWCHIRHLNPQEKYPQRIKKSDKEYVDKLDYSGIEFPVTIKQINKIEKRNNIRINVFSYEEKQPYPIYVSKEKFEDHIELLLITKDENKHYVLIKDFNKFMYQQTKHKERKHFCMHCLQCFSSERVLNNHKDNCIQVNGIQAVNMPEKGDNILKYNNSHKQQAIPFVIYSDFEAITEKIQGCRQNNDSSYTEAYQKHTDCGYGYKVVCCYDDKYTKPTQIYRGPKAVLQIYGKNA